MEFNAINDTVVNSYPFIRGCCQWLESKRADDGAEGLWRVHDKLYDLKDFVNIHPGGKEWILMTKGTDVTDVFESIHLYSKAKTVLDKYYIRDATTPRNYRLTFEENRFYQILKRKVLKKSIMDRSKRYFNIILYSAYMLSISTMRADNNLAKGVLVLLSGLFISWIVTISHNFVRQRNNIRMYFSNIMLHNWHDWRVFCMMLHHPYPNSYADPEISIFEPFYNWIPVQLRSIIHKVLSCMIIPFIYATTPFLSLISRLQTMIFSETKVFYWDELLGLTVPALMFIFSGKPCTLSALIEVFKLFFLIAAASGFFYNLNAEHHGINIVGDESRSLDFGIDRNEVNSNLFMPLAYFGDHLLDQLFSVLDFVFLPQLHDVFIEACKEF